MLLEYSNLFVVMVVILLNGPSLELVISFFSYFMLRVIKLQIIEGRHLLIMRLVMKTPTIRAFGNLS